MAVFPLLKTGAVAQYPLSTTLTYRADIVWFMDGSEQRFRNAPSVLHEWEIALDQLDEQEMASIESFFLENATVAGTFAFNDPSTGVTYPSCSIASDEMRVAFKGPSSGSTKLTIRENRE